MGKVIAKDFSSRRFHYHSELNCFTADVSDFNGSNLFSQVYDDSCDVGFGIVSELTGQIVTFYLHKEFRDREGDITHWVFTPIPESLCKFPHLKALTVEIFND